MFGKAKLRKASGGSEGGSVTSAESLTPLYVESQRDEQGYVTSQGRHVSQGFGSLEDMLSDERFAARISHMYMKASG